ncbi:MAG: trypsin-like peptidase domain-containing protein [Pseudomonadota bacterium]|nr:trypsin-like peptidase domain-containing protein [Pseudomonadota bacterium]
MRLFILSLPLIVVASLIAQKPSPTSSVSITKDGQLTAIERAMPTAVSIYIEQLATNPDHAAMGPGIRRSMGSGFFITENGYILTNAHVVAGAQTIRVVLYDGQERIGQMVGLDETTDLAVIRVKGDHYPYLALSHNQPHVGDSVYAIGNAFGQRNSVTSGIISALHRNSLSTRVEDFIQTDTAINMGNSGGPLVNIKGELIGVNTMIIGVAGGNNGVGFAIPTYMVKNISNQLIQYGSTQPAKMGVRTQDMTADLARAMDSVSNGSLISEVLPQSPAAKAGIKAKDIIVEVDGSALSSSGQLRSMVFSQRAGSKIQIGYYRGKKLMQTTIETESLDAIHKQATSHQRQHAIFEGVSMMAHEHLDDSGRKVTGLRVLTVSEGSKAWLSGIMNGDIIVRIDSKPLSQIMDIESHIKKGSNNYLIEVIRAGSPVYLALST